MDIEEIERKLRDSLERTGYVSKVYIFFPGGYGTLDELFEMVTLIQTQKIDPIPVVLVGTDYWQPLLVWLNETVLKRNAAISKSDLDIIHLFSDSASAHAFIKGLKIV